MDQGFCSREGQEFLDATNTAEMEEGRFTDGRDVRAEEQGVIKDDTQVPGRWVWLDGGLTYSDGKICGGWDVFEMEKKELSSSDTQFLRCYNLMVLFCNNAT